MIANILWNRYSFWSLCFLLLQQLIVASSTIWIVKLSEAVINHEHAFLYLGLFIGSLFLVYLPGIASSFYLEKSKCTAIFNYINQFSTSHRCFPTMLSEDVLRAEKEPWLTSESINTIEEATHVIYDSFATGLNTVFNIIALCVAINAIFIYGYIASFTILLVSTRFFKEKLSLNSLKAQSDRKNHAQSLLSGWDNIIIGNNYNLTIWWEQYRKRWDAYISSSSKNACYSQFASTSATILSLVPVCGMVFWAFITAKSEAVLVALIATLPRQIQIIQHFQIISTYTMVWHGVYAKINSFILSLSSPDMRDEIYSKRIKAENINIEINKKLYEFTTFELFVEKVNLMKNGKIRIQGSNGSGKTTIINLLKQKLGDKAYYYPVNTKLAFHSIIDESHSTGQKFKICFEEVLKSLHGVSVILLDEWDANLDKKNREEISKVINLLSSQYCIIEISHRENRLESDAEFNPELVTL